MTPEDHGSDLPRFADWRPTPHDARGLGSEGQEDWRVLPVIITRDSGPLDASNFETAQRMLDDAGAEYEVHRFGHWGPGWFEIIVVSPNDAGLRAAGEIACALADYPILDDEDHSSREMEAVEEAWNGWQEREWLDAVGRIVSERALDIIEADGAGLCRLAWDLSSGFAYEGDQPYLDADPRCLTRDHCAALLRAIRKGA